MHGRGRHGIRDAGAQGDDARDIRRLHRLRDAAEDHLVDEPRIETCAREQRIDRDAPEVVRRKRGEVGAAAAKRRPHSIDDNHAPVHSARSDYAALVATCAQNMWRDGTGALSLSMKSHGSH